MVVLSESRIGGRMFCVFLMVLLVFIVFVVVVVGGIVFILMVMNNMVFYVNSFDI